MKKDDLILDEWFLKSHINIRDYKFDAVYVIGGNNLPDIQRKGDTRKVRRINKEFLKQMWNVEGM